MSHAPRASSHRGFGKQGDSEGDAKLIETISARTGVPEAQIRAACQVRNEHAIPWSAIGLYGITIVIAVSAFVVSARLQNFPGPALLAEHIGVGFLVAALVGAIFHFAHERKLVGYPLEKIQRRIHEAAADVEHLGDVVSQKTSEWDGTLQQSLTDFKSTVAAFGDVMRFASDKRITGAFAPRSSQWRSATTAIIRDSDEFIYVSARTLRPFLVPASGLSDAGWLGQALDERFRRRSAPLPLGAFLLADVFNQHGEYREEMKLIFQRANERNDERAGCRDAIEWLIDLMSETRQSGTLDSPVSIRLSHQSPAIFMVMSEKAAVIGHYVPYMPLDSVRMIQFDYLSPLFRDFRSYFETTFALGVQPLESIKLYLMRHGEDETVHKQWKDARDKIANVSCSSVRMSEIIAERRSDMSRRGMRLNPVGVTSTVADRAVVTYQRGEQRFIDEVTAAARAASSITIVGRSHCAMLGDGYRGLDGGPKEPWLRDTLLHLLAERRPEVKVTVLLPDTFSERNEYYDEVDMIIKHRQLRRAVGFGASNMLHETRGAVDVLLDLAVEAKALPGALQVLLFKKVPRLCMLMTDQVAFVEVYMPGQDGGVSTIAKVGPQSMSHQYTCYHDYCGYLLDLPDTRPAVDVIAEYCTGRDSEYRRKRRALVEKWRELNAGPSA